MLPLSQPPFRENRLDWLRTVGMVLAISAMVFYAVTRFVRMQPSLPSELVAGVAALRAKDSAKAQREFDKALMATPKNTDTYLAIVEVLQNAKEWKLVVVYSRKAIAALPQSPPEIRAALLGVLATALSEAKPDGWKEESLAVAEKAHLLAKEQPTYMNLYGYMLADVGTTEGQWELSFQLLTRALRMAEEQAVKEKGKLFLSAVQDSYGWVLYRKKDYAGAILNLQRARDGVSVEVLQPDELKVYHYHLGAAYRKAGQIERARNELKTALQYDPKYEEALAESKLLP